MKTTAPSLKILAALILAITAAWLTEPLFGQAAATPTLTLTEASNTQLNWSWNGAGGGTSGTITTATPDVWLNAAISGEGFGSSGSSPFVNWQEPGSTGFQNQASFLIPASGIGGGWHLTVHSDVIGTGGIPDGQTFPGAGYNIVFVDSAATSETASVPDTGTTASLLGFSLVGLAFLRRKLS